jgi:hypothetical protein
MEGGMKKEHTLPTHFTVVIVSHGSSHHPPKAPSAACSIHMTALQHYFQQQQKLGGAAEARRAHNPEVPRSKRGQANSFLVFFLLSSFCLSFFAASFSLNISPRPQEMHHFDSKSSVVWLEVYMALGLRKSSCLFGSGFDTSIKPSEPPYTRFIPHGPLEY